jgi:hypothetical protein
MDELTQESRLKHFQLALSMVGVTANLMTCELIHALAHAVDEKGKAFSLGDAEALAQAVQTKYQMMMPPGMVPPTGAMPPEIEKLAKEGKIMMGKKMEDFIKPDPTEAEVIKEEPLPSN